MMSQLNQQRKKREHSIIPDQDEDSNASESSSDDESTEVGQEVVIRHKQHPNVNNHNQI